MQLEKGDVNIKNILIIFAFLIGFVGWFYSSIVIPLSNIQVQITQIQLTLKSAAQNFVNLQSQITANSDDIIILKQEIK